MIVTIYIYINITYKSPIVITVDYKKKVPKALDTLTPHIWGKSNIK